MMYVQQHTTTRSIKRQPTQLVDLDEQDHIIRLTHGAIPSRHRSSWLDDDVIWSAVAEIPLDQLAVPVVVGEAWRPRQGSVCLHSLHSAVRGICAKKDNDHQIHVIIADRCPTIDQEPLSIDAVRRFIVDFMAWGWTDSYRPSHLHSSPSHALHDSCRYF